MDRRVSVGSLPPVYDSDEPHEVLEAYLGAYLREEIRAEGFVRSIETFSRFLDIAALSSGEQVNFTAVGSVGSLLPPYQSTARRKPVATAKFYLFDTGVANVLRRSREVRRGSPEYGKALEHLIGMELKAYLSYRRRNLPLTYWRSRSQLEVDFVVGDQVAIEVKAADRVSERDWKGIRALGEEVPLRRKIMVCHERAAWTSGDGVEVWPAEEFLSALWADRIVQ